MVKSLCRQRDLLWATAVHSHFGLRMLQLGALGASLWLLAPVRLVM